MGGDGRSAGPDGLADIRRLVAGAPARLAPGGWLLIEHGHDQAAAVRALLADAGFADVRTRRDLSATGSGAVTPCPSGHRQGGAEARLRAERG